MSSRIKVNDLALAAGLGCSDGVHDWLRQYRRSRPARCRECGALRCQNFLNGGEHIYAPRCWQAGDLDERTGMVFCAGCGTTASITIDLDYYRLPADAYA